MNKIAKEGGGGGRERLHLPRKVASGPAVVCVWPIGPYAFWIRIQYASFALYSGEGIDPRDPTCTGELQFLRNKGPVPNLLFLLSSPPAPAARFFSLSLFTVGRGLTHGTLPVPGRVQPWCSHLAPA